MAPLTRSSSLGEVIAEFLRAAAADDDRELRSALSHVSAELGEMPVRSVRPHHVTAFLDRLRSAGLSRRREAAIVDALHAVFAFAVARHLVDADPMPDAPQAATGGMRTPAARPTPTPTPAPAPTFAMLALGARVAFWTTWIVTLGFLVLLLVLLVELG